MPISRWPSTYVAAEHSDTSRSHIAAYGISLPAILLLLPLSQLFIIGKHTLFTIDALTPVLGERDISGSTPGARAALEQHDDEDGLLFDCRTRAAADATRREELFEARANAPIRYRGYAFKVAIAEHIIRSTPRREARARTRGLAVLKAGARRREDAIAFAGSRPASPFPRSASPCR